ncbi:hypothetical protein [Actinomadura rubrisoli]|uniref:Uncharacterized protein n=1 Tax=Actinomadura rubrisoli TaxID=2530368 RepID=A0A4R5C5R9_9ACTN|nr:hypothetical protein [Actinomadura rubrisoli]TDD93360.1 hypothetical protein E1298_09895 [Actinomadura rubrisoli]
MRAASRARLFLAGLAVRHSTAGQAEVQRPGATAGDDVVGVPGRRAALPVTATDHLGALAGVLATAGWASRPRYEEIPALLRVFSPHLPALGESVWVKPGVGGVPWFVSSSGDPIAPCHDLAGAVQGIADRLGPIAEAAHAMADEGRRGGR